MSEVHAESLCTVWTHGMWLYVLVKCKFKYKCFAFILARMKKGFSLVFLYLILALFCSIFCTFLHCSIADADVVFFINNI